MRCYACEKEAVSHCSRCGRPYCSDHGAELCDSCLHPASSAPSGNIFHGSLLALLVASVLALWLLIRPPGLPTESVSSPVSPVPSPTPVAKAASATPTATPTRPLASTPEPGITPKPTVPPTPVATPTPSFQTYSVEAGDTLGGIAARFGVTVNDIMAANGFSDPGKILNIGDELKIPKPTPPPPTPTPVSRPSAG